MTTLAFGQTEGKSAVLFAGVNSSPADVSKGKNEHLRKFSVDTPSRRSPSSSTTLASAAASSLASPKVTEVARTSLFQTRDKDAYQRLLRLAPPPAAGPTLVGAAASAFAHDPEIAVFETGSSTSSKGAAVHPRGRLALEREAMDLDVIQTADNTYQLVHCDKYDLHLFTVAKADESNAASLSSPLTCGPECVYTMPHDTSSGSPDPNLRPSFRSIRYLNSGFLLAVANIPRRQGAIIQGFRLPPPLTSFGGKNTDNETESRSTSDQSARKARLAVSRRLPKSVTQATGLAVRNLNPPANAASCSGDTQFVIAVAGHDASISLYTLDHTTSKVGPSSSTGLGGLGMLSNLLPFATLNSIHPTHITGLSFSVFQAPGPSPPSGSPAAVKRSTPVIKLASVSVGNTAVVHAIPLRRVPRPSQSEAAEKLPRGIQIQQRYIVAIPPRKDRPVGLFVFTTLLVLFAAILGQTFLEAQGYTALEIIGARNFVPRTWIREPLPHVKRAQMHRNAFHHANGGFIYKLIQEVAKPGATIDPRKFHGPEGSKIILRDRAPMRADSERVTEGPDAKISDDRSSRHVRVEVHDEEVHGKAKEWEELDTPEQEAWKKKLKKSGYWIEDMGEAVFNGILFGEIGGMVGNVMAAAGAGM